MLKFKKDEIKDFVAINLGSYFIKGLIVKDKKICNYFIEHRKDLSELLKKIWQDNKIQTDKVKLSIKDPNCLIRIFPFIKLDRKKLKEALSYELSKHIPFSPEEVYFDFFILNEINQNEINLLLVAAKKNIIDPLLEIFEKQRLQVLEITLDNICLINLFLDRYKDKKDFNFSILDIGYSSSTLILFERGIPFIVRDLPYNVKEIVNVLTNVKGISSLEVEKWLFDLKDFEEFFKISNDILANLCKEIKTSFDYFELKKAKTIERLYITGGLANILYKKNFFKEAIGVDTEILNKDTCVPDLFKNAFSVAFGLTI